MKMLSCFVFLHSKSQESICPSFTIVMQSNTEARAVKRKFPVRSLGSLACVPQRTHSCVLSTNKMVNWLRKYSLTQLAIPVCALHPGLKVGCQDVWVVNTLMCLPS